MRTPISSRLARAFAPDDCVSRVTELTPDYLHKRKIRGLILDLDNTICHWQSEVIPEDVGHWLDGLRKAGFKLCIASNTHNRKRLHRMAAALDLRYVQGVPKPRRSCFRKAVSHLGIPHDQVAIVGDQLFTDVLGGKRSGIHTIMVTPMHPREFIGTKVTRLFERALLRWLRKRGLVPVVPEPGRPA